MGEQLVVFPGCGLEILTSINTFDKDFNASYVCRNLMFDLSYYTLSLHDDYFIHQLAVDAYAAQHIGIHTKSITITFALIGLFLFNERKYTGKQVQQAHIFLAHKTKTRPHFLMHNNHTSWITVQEVLRCDDEAKPEMIKKWSQSVWKEWKFESEKVTTLIDKYLGK